MKKLSILMLAGLLTFAFFLCGCEEDKKQNAIIEKKIEASDLFGDVASETMTETAE